MEHLIGDGVNINAVGRDGMTPLLWAFPGNKIERFELLLKHGADAGVSVNSDFNTRNTIEPGSTVSHLAAASEFPRQFILIMKYGGKPDLSYSRASRIDEITLLMKVLNGSGRNKKERVSAILENKPDLQSLEFATRLAVSSAYEYEIAIMLLEYGVDFKKYDPYEGRFIHTVAFYEKGSFGFGDKKRASFEKLVAWLEAHGEDFEMAKRDVKKWVGWLSPDLDEGAAMRKRDIANRIELEKKARQSDDQPKN